MSFDDMQQVLLDAMQLGLTREEAQRMVGNRSPTQARAALAQHLVPGYEQARKVFARGSPAEREGGFVSPATWRYMPEQLQLRRMMAKPVSEFETDPKTGRPVIESGWIRRGQEAHAFPASVLTQGSYLAQTATGEHIATWQPEKWEKRTQMLGAHEFLEMQGLESRRAFMPSGPLARRGEPGQVIRTAAIVGGDIGGPGAAIVDPRVGMATQRTYRQIEEPGEGRMYPWVSSRGATFEPGTRMTLAGGLAGEPTGKFGYRVLDVAALTGGGYGFAMERYAAPTAARLRMKFAGQKVEATVGPQLRGMTFPSGEPVGALAAYGLKDVQGYAYQHFMAKDPAYLAGVMGVEQSALPPTYSQLGTRAMESFSSQVLPQILKTVHMREMMTEQAAARYRESGAMVSEQQLPGGRVYGKVAHQALVGDVLQQFGHDYPVRRPFLGHEELEHIQRQQPELHQRIMRGSEGGRAAYQDVANAILASTGRYELPEGTIGAEGLNLGGMMVAAQEQAREKLGYGPEAEPPAAMVRKLFMERLAQSEAGQRHIAVETEAGRAVLPPGQTLQQFGAGGKFEGEEVSKYAIAAERLLSHVASGGGRDEAITTLQRFTAAQQTLGGVGPSKPGQPKQSDFARRLTGAFLPKGRSAGDILHTSQALKPWEAYVPGMGGQAIQPFAFPSGGGRMWGAGMQMVGLTEKEAAARGINPKEMTLSMDLIQALGRDVDGDLGYALSLGAVTRHEDGSVRDAKGRRLDSSQAILEAAREAREEGAANVYKEMAGMQGPGTALTHAQAMEMVRGDIRGATAYSGEQVEEQIAKGAGLRARIGQYYNVFRGASATTPDAAREAQEKVFRLSHGRAQRPAEQLPGMQVFHRLAKASLISPTTGRLSAGAFDPSTGGPMPMAGGLRGIAALQAGAARGLLSLGEGLPPEQFGQYMGTTPKAAGTLTKLASAYQRFEGRRPDIAQSVMGAMGKPVEWGLGSEAGRTLAPTAVTRGMERLMTQFGKTFPEAASAMGLSETQASQFMEMRRQQQARNLAMGRGRPADISEFEAKMGAISEVTGTQFVKPITSAEARPPAEEAPLTAPGAGGAEPPVRPPTVAAAAAAVPGGGDDWERWRSILGAQGAATQPPAAAQRVSATSTGGMDPDTPRGRDLPPDMWDPGSEYQQGPALTEEERQQYRAGGQAGGPSWQRPTVHTGHVKQLEQITQELKDWGPVIRKIVKSGEQMDTGQKRVVTAAKGMAETWEKIARMDPREGPGGAKAFQAAGALLGGIEPQMGMLGQARKRLRDQMFAEGGGAGGEGGGGGGWGDWGKGGRLGGMIGERGIGGAGKYLTTGWGMLLMRRLWGQTGGKIAPWIQAAGREDLQTYQAAMVSGAPIAPPTGLGGALINRQIRAQAGRVALGRQAAAAWTMPQAGMWERGPLGAAMGIGMPALGAGMMAGMMAGGPAGVAVGGMVGAIGAGNYLYQQAADPTARGVGYAAMRGQAGGEGWRGAGAGEFAGGIVQSLRVGIQGLFGYDAPRRQMEREAGMGERILSGQTAGLPANAMARALQGRGDILSERFGVMGGGEYASMMAQMQRMGGYENLADIPEGLITKSAALTRAKGLAPGGLQLQQAQIGRAWGLQTGTQGMADWQASMLAAPTDPDYERQMRAYQQYQPLARWGVTMGDVGGAPTLDPMQQFRAQQLGAGNRIMWSDIGRAAGDRRLETLEQGGLPMFTTGLGQWDPGAMGLQTQAAAGGMWGIQDRMTEVQRQYRNQGLGRQQAQLGWQAQMGWGGAGYTPMAPAAGSAMGLQDQMRTQAYQGQMEGLGYQGQMLDMRNRQFMESLGMRRQVFESRVGWQREDMARQGERAGTRFGWQMQDWSYGENRAQLGFGWQMEDFDEAIRTSSGRQRRQLQRRRERVVISESMRREHHEDQRERLEEMRDWQKEDFGRAKERNEELVGLQRRQFDQSKRHHQETYRLQKQNIARIRGQYIERKRLQDALIKLQRKDAMKRHEWAQSALKDQLALNRQMDGLQDDYRILGRSQQELVADWQRMVLYGEQFAQYFNEMFEAIMTSSGGTTTTGRPGTPSDPTDTPYVPPPDGPGYVEETKTFNINVRNLQEAQVADTIALTLTEYDRSFG